MNVVVHMSETLLIQKVQKKTLIPLFFWKTGVHSDASSFSAFGVCETLATFSPSSQPTATDELIFKKKLSQGQR